jgi:EAL domain-containing protein (putative c-di-GMP-specific phosphodiesterase class I)
LKIDQSFVSGSGKTRFVLPSLDFEVVAEGVETEEQAAFLRHLGCQKLQGYLHGRAVAPAEFRARWSIR